MLNSLYLKYRPRSLNDLIGQDAIVRILNTELTGNTVHHAYIFRGIHGTGKTSTARILARTMNCLHPENNIPCGVCKNCSQLLDERIGYLELDAASNRGIDDIREIKSKLMFSSIQNYKLIVIDEAHMLTKEAFNALLKMLEEPPANTIFILATTNFEKIPATIVSRCQTLIFKKVPQDALQNHLKRISLNEGFTFTESAIQKIVISADGSVRNAINFLEKVSKYQNGRIDDAAVTNALGMISNDLISELLEALKFGSPLDIRVLVDKISNENIQIESVFEKVISVLLDYEYLVSRDVGVSKAIELLFDGLRKISYTSIKASLAMHVFIQIRTQELLNKMQLDKLPNEFTLYLSDGSLSYDTKTHYMLETILSASEVKIVDKKISIHSENKIFKEFLERTPSEKILKNMGFFIELN